jgi:uncharacterized protein (DUF885 family)
MQHAVLVALAAAIALGNRFPLKAFHPAVLAAGSVPLDILEQQIDQFIQAAKG